MTPAAPAKNGQYQPSTKTSSKDCVAATAAMLVERATAGAIRPSHADIRDWVLKHGGGRTKDGKLRGLLMSEAAAAVKALYGVTLTPTLGLSRDQVKNIIGNGRGAGVSIDCSVTVHTSRATNSYTGGHEVYAHDYQWWPGGMRCECEKLATYAHGEDLIEDPGTTLAGYKWWSHDLLCRAAEARGGGKINLLVGPDTEGASWRAIAAAEKRSEPSYTTGRRLGTLKRDHVYKGGRTQNGGDYRRADGTMADEWVHLQDTDDSWFWSKGRALQLVAA